VGLDVFVGRLLPVDVLVSSHGRECLYVEAVVGEALGAGVRGIELYGQAGRPGWEDSIGS
jgi:hypothetical protein